MLECERNAVKLGDGVYVLGWSSSKNRPVLRVYDPGFSSLYGAIDDVEEDPSQSTLSIRIQKRRPKQARHYIPAPHHLRAN